MPTYLAPGVYVEERSTGPRAIAGVSTSTGAFIGVAERGPVGVAIAVTGFAEFVRWFGGPIGVVPGVREHYLYFAVRHFFESGGSRCYVVRTAHYGNINDAASLTATAAFRAVSAQNLALGNVGNAVRVAARTPGTWGNTVEVALFPTSKFQLRLAAPITSGANHTSILLPANDDVVSGSVLHLVHEVTGVVTAVNATTRVVTFTERLQEGTGNSTVTLASASPLMVFKPDYSAVTTTDLTANADLGLAMPPGGLQMRLASVDRIAPGDSLHFALVHAVVRVLAIEDALLVSTPVKRAIIGTTAAPVTLGTFPADRTRVYARDFSAVVRIGGDVVETHPNLSLVAIHPDYVNGRLGEGSGGSLYVVVNEQSGSTAELVHTRVDFAPMTTLGNDGLADLSISDFAGSPISATGLHALDPVEDASILVVGYSRISNTATPLPAANQLALTKLAIAWVENRKDMIYVVDPPKTAGATPVQEVRTFAADLSSSYAALYFPWLAVADPVTGNRIIVPPSGAVAGIYARSDAKRGVHKAPAGFDVGLVSLARGTAHDVTRGENDLLYPEKINTIRNMTDGIVVWGSRTLSADPLWLQVNVRRLFIYLERSIELGTQWVVFEPNDRMLWKTIERSIKSFLFLEWIEERLVGETQAEAFFVRCNAETNPPEVVDAGMVVTEIGVAPSRPAEFVVFRIRQFAGQEA